MAGLIITPQSFADDVPDYANLAGATVDPDGAHVAGVGEGEGPVGLEPSQDLETWFRSRGQGAEVPVGDMGDVGEGPGARGRSFYGDDALRDIEVSGPIRP